MILAIPVESSVVNLNKEANNYNLRVKATPLRLMFEESTNVAIVLM